MALAAALKADPKAKIQVQAFGKNKVEAGARAQAIKQILTTLGVKAGQLSAKGMTDGADMNASRFLKKIKKRERAIRSYSTAPTPIRYSQQLYSFIHSSLLLNNKMLLCQLSTLFKLRLKP